MGMFTLCCKTAFVARQVNVFLCISAVTFNTNSPRVKLPPYSPGIKEEETPSVTCTALFFHHVISAGGLLEEVLQCNFAREFVCNIFGSMLMVAFLGGTINQLYELIIF